MNKIMLNYSRLMRILILIVFAYFVFALIRWSIVDESFEGYMDWIVWAVSIGSLAVVAAIMIDDWNKPAFYSGNQNKKDEEE